ncbi:MAG: OmpH family outer membrane protein [Planctomycetes bacterium]|nr:OmpH family outer membrane protein [Planctomycetota bacterium]
MSALRSRSVWFSPTFAAACVLGICFVAGMSVRSGARPMPAPTAATVGLVDIRKLMNSLDELKARNEGVAAKGKSLQDKLADLDKQIKDIDNEMKLLPENETRKRTEKVALKFELRATLEARAKAYQQMINLENGEILNDLYTKVQKAAGQFAAREGYDFIVIDDRAISLPPNGTDKEYNEIILTKRLLHVKDGFDVTDSLLTMMNNEYSASLKKQ